MVKTLHNEESKNWNSDFVDVDSEDEPDEIDELVDEELGNI